MVSQTNRAPSRGLKPGSTGPLRMVPGTPAGCARGLVSRRALITAVMVVLFFKLVLFAYVLARHPQGFFPPDARSYLVPAAELIEHGTFTHDGRPVLFRTPGYSVFLAPIVALLGMDKVYVVVLVQMALALLVAGMVHASVRLLGGCVQEARWAFLVVLVDPAWVMGEFSVVTEVVYTVCLMGAILAVAWYERVQREPALVLAGLALTAAAFVRPIAFYLGGLFLATVGWFLVRRKRWHALGFLGVALIFNIVALGAWEYRNARTFGEPIFTSVQGRNLYAYNAAAVRARAEGLDYRAVQKACLRDRVSDNPAVQARYEERRGLEILARYPVSTLVVTLKGLMVNLFDPGTGAILNLVGLRQSGSGIIYRFQNMAFPAFVSYLWRHEIPLLVLTALGGLWIAGFWIAAGLGLLRTWRTWQPVIVLMLLVIVYHLGVSAGPASTFRFRTPVVPLVAMLIGPGVYSLLRKGGDTRSNNVREPRVDRAT